jgi:hypothetical protein
MEDLMDAKSLVGLIKDLVGKGASVASVLPSALPDPVTRTTAEWACRTNLPTEGSSTRQECYCISSPNQEDAYLIDFSGSDPGDFEALLVVRGNNIIGESLALAW